MYEWIVFAVNSLWLNRPLKFYRKHPSSLRHQGHNRDYVQKSCRGGLSKMVVHTRHLIKQMSPWLVAGTYTHRSCSVLRSLLFPKAARMWSYFHKSWAARDAPLFTSVFNQASNAVPVWNLTAPKGNFWHLSTFTMNNYCITISIRYSSIVCDDWIPDSWITVLQLMVLDNQTTSLCCSVMNRDKIAGLWKSLHHHDYVVLLKIPQWQDPSRCKTKEKTTAKVISHHEVQRPSNTIQAPYWDKEAARRARFGEFLKKIIL